MSLYPREQGPRPTAKRNQWRQGLERVQVCYCQECRTLNPAKQRAWERLMQETRKDFVRVGSK